MVLPIPASSFVLVVLATTLSNTTATTMTTTLRLIVIPTEVFEISTNFRFVLPPFLVTTATAAATTAAATGTTEPLSSSYGCDYDHCHD